MSLSSTTTLNGLTAHKVIVNALYYIMSALDKNYVSHLAAGMTSDIMLTINSNDSYGFNTVNVHSFNNIGAMHTTHFITNIGIRIDGTGYGSNSETNGNRTLPTSFAGRGTQVASEKAT